MADLAPGLKAQLAEAYAEFAESDSQLAQKRADLVAREAALKAKQQALHQRKCLQPQTELSISGSEPQDGI